MAKNTEDQNDNAETPEEELPSIVEFSEDVGEQDAPEPLPKKDYIGEVKQVEVKRSKAGNKMAVVTFNVSPDQFPADYTDGDLQNGANLRWFRVILEDTPNGRYSVKQFCQAVGAPTGTSIDTHDWIGRQARITVTHDTYEGRTVAQIKSIHPVE